MAITATMGGAIRRSGQFLRKAVSPEVRELFTPRVPGRVGKRLGTSLTTHSLKPVTQRVRRRRQARALAGHGRRLRAMTHVLPPKAGSRREQFSSYRDGIWDTPIDAIVTSQRVKPRKSIWTTWKSTRRAA